MNKLFLFLLFLVSTSSTQTGGVKYAGTDTELILRR